MAATFTLIVLDREHTFYEGEASSVVLPGGKGSFGVLARHTPLVSTLESGTLSITEPSGKILRYGVGAGLVETGHNRTTLYLDSPPEEITGK